MADWKATVEEVYDAHGFTQEGVRCLQERIEKDAQLRAHALHQAAHDGLREHMRAVRSEIQNGNGRPKEYSAATQAAVEKTCRGFLDRPLMDGTPLAKATRETLMADVERYEAYAAGNAREARFLRQVAGKLKEAETVAQKWSEKQLERAYEKVKKS